MEVADMRSLSLDHHWVMTYCLAGADVRGGRLVLGKVGKGCSSRGGACPWVWAGPNTLSGGRNLLD